ncbi:hypothetical protein BH09PAT4_BH09PAT4_09250 [soil metagenome]
MMVTALVVSSLTALLPQQSVSAAVPTNQSDCASAGGTWTNNDHIHNVCTGLAKIAILPLIDQAKSFADLNGLYDCFTKSDAQMDDSSLVKSRDRISVDHVKSGQWWATTASSLALQTAGAETAGSYLNSKTNSDHGNTLNRPGFRAVFFL